MERITSKEVTSMMQAVAQVYEQPEAEQLDEIVRILRPGESVKEYEERKAREQQSAAAKRRGVEDRIYRDGGGDAKVKEFQDKGYTLGQARRATMNQGRTNQRNAKPSSSSSQSTTSGMTPAQVKAAQDAANQARRDGKMGGLPSDYKETELQAGRDAEKSRTGAGLPQSGGGNQGNYGKGSTTKPATASDPNVTKDGTKFERRMPTSAELRAAQQARRDAPKVLSRDEIENRAVKAAVGVAKGTVKDPKIAADANRKAELERIRQRAALQTRAGVRPTVASTADSQSRTAAGMMSNKSASGSGPGGYQLPAGARPLTYGNAAATPVTPAATGAGSAAQRVQAVRLARMNPRNRNTQLNQGDPMERMTGKGAASLLETYSKVYEEREPQAIDEGIMGALAKVGEEVAEEKTAADPGMKARMGKEAPKKGGYQLPKRTPANAKNVEYYKDDADLFDIIKGHFIEEGLTEEEALAKMLDLTDEERTEIIEGSCGSKKKSKKKGGY